MSMRYPGGLIASSPVNAAYPSGVWTQAQTQPYAAQNVWMRDQFWPNTTLLLQGNGTNGAQNNTFLDSSTNNFTITRNGNTTQGSFTPYEANGYWSNFFDGSGDYLQAADSASLSFSGDFTCEGWFFYTGTAASLVPSILTDSGTSAVSAFEINNGSTFLQLAGQVANNTINRTTFSGTVAPGVWTHIAYVRSSNVIRVYVNGVVSATTLSNSAATGRIRQVGEGRTSGLPFPGYISNFRLVGSAVYTSNFTPSTSPLTAITNTSLLTCQSNRFIDNSTNAFAITVNGETSVQAFQPFPGATTWSGSVLGGSGYFDGSGDNLTAANNAALYFGTGDFTIECWIYTSATVSFQTIATVYGAPTSNNGWYFSLNSAGTGLYLSVFNGSSSAVLDAGSGLNDGAWHHVAAVRTGTTLSTYIDGARVATTTNSFNITATSDLRISGYPATSRDWNGYISNFRIIKGSGPYSASSSTLTVPAAPLTAITNTSLLCNFTNAGIFDSAMMNNLETVGNAQVSTSVVKYGTGSMAFDGSGDILSAPASQNFVFGGDLTVEGWVYINSSMASSRPDNLKIFIFAGWNTGNTPQFYVNGTTSTPGTGLGYYDGTNDYQVAVTIPKDQWVHLAYVRSGAVISGFVNGVRYTITSSYSSTIGSANTFVIGGNPNQVSAYYSYLNGYIDDLRITKGAARYIGNFTPPVARMPGQ